VETGDKVRLIDDSVLFPSGEVRAGTTGVILFPTWVDVDFDEDETDGYYVEFMVNGELERWNALETELELIASAV